MTGARETRTGYNTQLLEHTHSYKRRRLYSTTMPRPPAVNINARFDRMLERANGVLSLAPRLEGSSPSQKFKKRGRRRPASSTSGSSERAPPTPVDMYDTFEGGRLGKGFTVFMSKSRQLQEEQVTEVIIGVYILACMAHICADCLLFLYPVLSFSFFFRPPCGVSSLNHIIRSHNHGVLFLPGFCRHSPPSSPTTLFGSLPLPLIQVKSPTTRRIQAALLLTWNAVSPTHVASSD